MKRIIISLCIISATAALAFGATTAFFSDTETSTGNTFTAGTVEIDINGQSHWMESFSLENMLPGEMASTTLLINNTGQNPIKLWKRIANLTTQENKIVEPEKAWYDQHNAGNPKNDIDTAIVYEMFIDGQMAISQQAGITMDQIKDYYMGLVKIDIGANPAQYGILSPGESVEVVQNYYLKNETENWAQSDKLIFDIEIIAQQIDAPEPIQQISFMEDKNTSGNWQAMDNAKMGILKYNSRDDLFNYQFVAVGMDPNATYKLIYYPDPWAYNKQVVLLSNELTVDAQGKIDSGVQNIDAGASLPYITDANYPYGAKIWLVPTGSLSGITLKWSNINHFLYDNWPGLINYRQGEAVDYLTQQNSGSQNSNSNNSSQNTIYLNELEGDINNQYAYQHDYAASTVNFAYNSPASGKLSGTLTASGLKPYTTYQAKFQGKPTCEYGVSGNDAANEYIGYKGRWTCVDCGGSAVSRNRTDAEYEANKLLSNGHPDKKCIAGYLVWDFFTADENGDAATSLETSNSYHVLWCGGGTCDTIANTYLDFLDMSHPSVKFCPVNKVNGEIERFTCGGMSLDPGSYDVRMVLTEESFHQGNWASVLGKDVSFEIE